jgi:Type IV secretion-system coupling protein DNA-binding domain
MNAEALAASLIRGQPRNNSQHFFQESSRTLLESIFQVLKGDQVLKDDQDLSGIREFLAQACGKIHESLRGTRAYPLVDPQAHHHYRHLRTSLSAASLGLEVATGRDIRTR